MIAVGTLIDLYAPLPETRPPLMRRVCMGMPYCGASCGIVLGWVVCVPAQAGQITHSLCGDCLHKWQRMLVEEVVVQELVDEYTTPATGSILIEKRD